jgi:hypothetical protein
MVKNGKGVVFPGDKLDLSKVFQQGVTGIIATDADAIAGDESGNPEFNNYLWIEIYGSPGYTDGEVEGWLWTWFERHGKITQFIISRANPVTDVPSPNVQAFCACQNPNVTNSFIGIGPIGYQVKVCSICKQEVR